MRFANEGQFRRPRALCRLPDGTGRHRASRTVRRTPIRRGRPSSNECRAPSAITYSVQGSAIKS